jgi:hypothetical protein
MRQPYKITLWTADGNAQLLNVVMSVETAQRVFDSRQAGQFGSGGDKAGLDIHRNDGIIYSFRNAVGKASAIE